MSKIYLPVKSESHHVQKSHYRSIDTVLGKRTIVINPDIKKIRRNRLVFQHDMNKILSLHPVIKRYLEGMSVNIEREYCENNARIQVLLRRLYITPSYFANPEPQRLHTLLHEIGHIVFENKMRPYDIFFMFGGKRHFFEELCASLFSVDPEFVLSRNKKWFMTLWRIIKGLTKEDLKLLEQYVYLLGGKFPLHPKNIELMKVFIGSLMNNKKMMYG